MLPTLKEMVPYLILGIALIQGSMSIYERVRRRKGLSLFKHFNKIQYALVILLCIVGALQVHYSSFVERQFWYQGSIQGSEIDDPAFKLGDAKIIPSDDLKILFTLVGDPLEVWIHDGKLQLFTIVRNENGKQMVAVTGNNFVINPNTVSDFNYDENSLEVLNKKGDVVLQIQMQNDGVLFCGIFNLIDGSKVALGNNIIEIRFPGENLQTSFEKLFKYPGKHNLGVRIP
jgi:hypothetical protein